MHSPTDVILESSEEIGLIGSKIVPSDNVIETNMNNILSFVTKDNYIYLLNSSDLLVIENNDFDEKHIKRKA